MNTSLTIGELAKETGLPTKTIRYYEEIGLIGAAPRRDNSYRAYPLTSSKELGLIKQARDLGIPIAEIKKLIRGCEGKCDHNRETVERDLGKYLTVVDERLNQLNRLKKKLVLLQKHITNSSSDDPKIMYCCNFLTQLLNLEEKGGEEK